MGTPGTAHPGIASPTAHGLSRHGCGLSRRRRGDGRLDPVRHGRPARGRLLRLAAVAVLLGIAVVASWSPARSCVTKFGTSTFGAPRFGAAKPSTAKPSTARSGAARSGAARSGAARSGAARSGATKPGTARSGAAAVPPNASPPAAAPPSSSSAAPP